MIFSFYFRHSYDMSGRLMPPLTGLDPYKPFTPTSSVGGAAHSMLDAHTASMRSLMNMDQNNSNMQQQQPPNNVASPYYPSPLTSANPSVKDMPPAAHMFNTKSSTGQSSATANLHQMLNNTMSMAYASREHQHHLMQHPSTQQQQQQPQQHPNQTNAYSQQIPNSIAPAPVVVETKPKRIRKKKAPAAAAAVPAPVPKANVDIRQNQIQTQQQQQQQTYHQNLQQQQQQPPLSHQQHQLPSAHQGFQSYSHLKTNQTNNKASPNHILPESSTTSLKSTANSAVANLPNSSSNPSVPGMVPGSAFNFGPSGAGLGMLYGSPDGAPNFLDDFRNPQNAYYIPPAHHRSTPDSSSGGNATASDKSAAAAAAAAVAATSAAAAAASAPSSYHQFLSHAASSRASPYGFMSTPPSLDPNAQMYQSAQLRQMMLGQGILGHGAPAPYGYHPALGMHKSPYDPMGQINRPPWYQ